MVNQWGRDGNFGSGSAGSSRSGGGIIVAAIIALIIGAGGGYAGGRFFSGVSTSDIAARDEKIAELSQTLSDMKFDSQGSTTQQNVMRQRVKDLETQVASLSRTNDTLKKNANQQASKAGDDAQAEIAALKKTIDEAGDLQGKLNRAQKSMKVSELQIIELENTARDQKAEIDRLNDTIAQSSGKIDPAIALLKSQKQMLQAQLDGAKSQLSTIPGLKSELASLKDQLAKRADDACAEAKQQIAGLQKQKDALQAKLDAALKSSGNVEQQSKKISELQKQLDEMAESLSDRDAAARDAEKELAKAKTDLDKSLSRLQDLKDQNKTLGAAQNDLKQQIASLNATIASLKAAAAPAEDKPATNDTNTNDQNDAGLSPRDRADVEKAVGDLPGFDNLGADKQQTLIGMLEKGECVTDSLKAAYGHVSPIALRSLFRDLGGGC